MELLLYAVIFIIGIILGNFCMIAIYKIPSTKKNKDKKSFSPKQKRNKVIISLLMGFVSIGAFISLKVTWKTMTILTLIEYLYLMIFIVTLVLIAGIDKKSKRIYKPIIFIGCLVGFVHIIYLYLINNLGVYSIYKYLMYFAVICILSAIIIKKQYFKYSYLLEIMIICMYMNMFVISEVFLITIALTMISIVASIIMQKQKQKRKLDKSDILAEKNINVEIPIGMYLCISNIIAMIIQGIEINVM